MTTESKYMEIDPNSASIQTHLSIIQNVIQRMAANSSSSKAWCIALVSAILVIVADKDKPEMALIALLPITIFAALDIYYLALEKAFRNAYNQFISKLHKGNLEEENLYSVEPVGKMSELQIQAALSFSVWGFYISLALLVVVAKWVVLG